MTRRCFALLLFVASSCGVAGAQQPLRGYQPQVSVQGETRIDWIFALANQSRPEPPADWVAGFDSAAQRYELFVPPNLDPRKPAPLVLFISPSNRPAGWSQWQRACQQAGVIYASPFAAGNDCPMQRRVRIVLDVLDDIRRRFTIDADRTYLGGFSGGARISCAVAFALPEHFGGVVPVCGAENLREESWLRQRVVDRLSVALITGETDFNRTEVEKYRGPVLTDIGVRTKVWTVPKLGHGIPDDKQLAAALAWLEEGAKDRAAKAKAWPAMRIAGNAAPSRTEWADALLGEAKKRLEKPTTMFTGLMQLQGITVRWGDLPAAAAARKLLVEYDGRADRPWEADDIAEQRRFLLAEARALGAYAVAPLPKQYENERVDMAKAAIEMWKQVLADGPTTPAAKEAAAKILELQKVAEP